MDEKTIAYSKVLQDHDRGIESGGFATAAMLLSLSSFGVRLLSLLTTSIVARILIPADYGIISLALAVTGFLDVLTNIQVSGSIIRATEVTEEQLRSAFTINVIRGVVSGLFLFAFANQLAGLLGDMRLTEILRTLAIAPVLNGLQNPVFILFERKLQFLPDILRTLLATTVGSTTCVLVALHFHSYWALVANTLVISGVHLLMTYWRVPRISGFSFSRFGEMFSFGSWLVLVSLVEYANGKCDVLIVGKGVGNSLLGQYQAGGQIVYAATGDVVGPLVRAIFPTLAMSENQGDLRKKYVQIQALIISLALPIGIGISAMATDVVHLLLGSNWDMAIPVVRILGPMFAIQTVLATVDAVAMSKGRTRELFLRTCTVFIVRIILLLTGFYLGGFMGVIYARVLSGSFYLVYGLRLAGRLTNTSLLAPLVNSWRSGCAALVMFALLESLGKVLPHISGSSVTLLFTLSARVAFGASTYVFVHAGLWWLAERPEGVESTIIDRIRLIRRGRNITS